MHGHSYRLEVAVAGPLQTRGPARGMIEDFDHIERIVAERVIDALDHQHLNDFIENPNGREYRALDLGAARKRLRRPRRARPLGDRDLLRRPAAARDIAALTCVMLQLSEIFYTIQGEGTWTGTPAVFVRLAGCNLACDFCDTDYSTKFFASVDDVVAACAKSAAIARWSCSPAASRSRRPRRRADRRAARDGRRVHVESNGTIFTELPDDVWLCVSPKERVDPRMAARANEAKLIVDERVPEEHLALFAEQADDSAAARGQQTGERRARARVRESAPATFPSLAADAQVHRRSVILLGVRRRRRAAILEAARRTSNVSSPASARSRPRARSRRARDNGPTTSSSTPASPARSTAPRRSATASSSPKMPWSLSLEDGAPTRRCPAAQPLSNRARIRRTLVAEAAANGALRRCAASRSARVTSHRSDGERLSSELRRPGRDRWKALPCCAQPSAPAFPRSSFAASRIGAATAHRSGWDFAAGIAGPAAHRRCAFVRIVDRHDATRSPIRPVPTTRTSSPR